MMAFMTMLVHIDKSSAGVVINIIVIIIIIVIVIIIINIINIIIIIIVIIIIDLCRPTSVVGGKV